MKPEISDVLEKLTALESMIFRSLVAQGVIDENGKILKGPEAEAPSKAEQIPKRK